MWLYSTTVAGAAPESDRLPVLPEPALAGSPVGSHTVGKAGGDVKKGAVLCRLAIGIAVMPHSEFLAAALEAARAADDVEAPAVETPEGDKRSADELRSADGA